MKMKMTTRAVPILAALMALAAFLAAPPAVGAEEPEEELVAEVPFDFMVDGEKFAAGTYEVEVGPGITDEPPVLAIQTASESMDELRYKKIFATVGPEQEAERGSPRLVFKRVGKTHFLEKVVTREGEAHELN